MLVPLFTVHEIEQAKMCKKDKHEKEKYKKNTRDFEEHVNSKLPNFKINCIENT